MLQFEFPVYNILRIYNPTHNLTNNLLVIPIKVNGCICIVNLLTLNHICMGKKHFNSLKPTRFFPRSPFNIAT